MRANTLKSFICLLGLLIVINGFAATTKKNLSDVQYPNKIAVTTAIHQLFADTNKDDAYSLSLPLIASAQQGDRKTYDIVLTHMITALAKLPGDDFKAWMLGRALLAADSIDDAITVKNFQTELMQLLTELRKKPRNYTHTEDAFYAWAWGYLGRMNPKLYEIAKIPLFESQQGLGNFYKQTKNHDALSNATWSWILFMQAAANANDKATCASLQTGLKQLTNQSTVRNALNISLTRSNDSSDYPAWGLAIVYLAAANSDDHALRNELKEPVTQSIAEAIQWGAQPNQPPANQWKAKAEATLARINQVLAGDY